MTSAGAPLDRHSNEAAPEWSRDCLTKLGGHFDPDAPADAQVHTLGEYFVFDAAPRMVGEPRTAIISMYDAPEVEPCESQYASTHRDRLIFSQESQAMERVTLLEVLRATGVWCPYTGELRTEWAAEMAHDPNWGNPTATTTATPKPKSSALTFMDLDQRGVSTRELEWMGVCALRAQDRNPTLTLEQMFPGHRARLDQNEPDELGCYQIAAEVTPDTDAHPAIVAYLHTPITMRALEAFTQHNLPIYFTGLVLRPCIRYLHGGGTYPSYLSGGGVKFARDPQLCVTPLDKLPDASVATESLLAVLLPYGVGSETLPPNITTTGHKLRPRMHLDTEGRTLPSTTCLRGSCFTIDTNRFGGVTYHSGDTGPWRDTPCAQMQ
jgi:hypothetical protein